MGVSENGGFDKKRCPRSFFGHGTSSVNDFPSYAGPIYTCGIMRHFPIVLYWIIFIHIGYGSIPINTIFRGMNIHLPALLMFTRGKRFWPIPIFDLGDNLGEFDKDHGARDGKAAGPISRICGISEMKLNQSGKLTHFNSYPLVN